MTKDPGPQSISLIRGKRIANPISLISQSLWGSVERVSMTNRTQLTPLISPLSACLHSYPLPWASNVIAATFGRAHLQKVQGSLRKGVYLIEREWREQWKESYVWKVWRFSKCQAEFLIWSNGCNGFGRKWLPITLFQPDALIAVIWASALVLPVKSWKQHNHSL